MSLAPWWSVVRWFVGSLDHWIVGSFIGSGPLFQNARMFDGGGDEMRVRSYNICIHIYMYICILYIHTAHMYAM